MINYIRIIALTILLSTSCVGQVLHTVPSAAFTFPEMDQTVLSFWVSESGEIKSMLMDISEEWGATREDILGLSISHFDPVSFVEDQDRRILSIYHYVDASQYLNARQEAYILLTEFKDVRECFTSDVYELDFLLEAYSGYLSVHEIIHDEMLGLYEWSEFVWFVDQLKAKVERLDGHLLKNRLGTPDEKVYAALEKLKGCLATLDDSLGDAYRPDFEMPCNELNESFIELWRAYNQLITLS